MNLWKKICDHAISEADKTIDYFYNVHNKDDKHIRTNTNEYITRRHFFHEIIEDVNDASLKNNVGFVFDVDDDVYDYFEEKIVVSIKPKLKRTYKEMKYQLSLHKKYMWKNKLIVRLKEPSANLHVFTLKIFT